MTIFRAMLATAAVGTLAACGGSGDGRPSYDELNTRYDQLADVVIGQEIFQPEALPTSGSQTYDGAISFFIFDASIELIGELELSTGFAGNGSINGTADNFSDNVDFEFDGELTIDNGAIFRDGNPNTAGFVADMAGDLSSTNGEVDLSVDSIVVGDFYGDNYEYIFGAVRGTLDVDGGETFEINDGRDRFDNVVDNADGDGFFFGQR